MEGVCGFERRVCWDLEDGGTYRRTWGPRIELREDVSSELGRKSM